MNNMKVNSNSKLYNTTPTPTSQPTGRALPSSSTSSISSQSSGFSLSNLCHGIVSLVQRGWNWFKEKILRIKPKPVQSVPTPVYVPTGNILTDFKNSPATIIQLKQEHPKAFLKGVTEQFLQHPETFFEEAFHVYCSKYFSDSENSRISEFFNSASNSLGKTGQLDLDATMRFFEQETKAGGRVIQIDVDVYIKDINKDLGSEANQEKVKAAMGIYQRWLRGGNLQKNPKLL